MPREDEDHTPQRFSAEFDADLESLIGHPQLLDLVRRVLGPEIRYDHCVALNREGGNQGSRWHSHEYADDDPALGFVRVFFYANGFAADDGGLKVVPGSQLYRDPAINADSDAALAQGWLAGKVRPASGQPLRVEELSVPPGTVVLMWTHAAHGVNPRKEGQRHPLVRGLRVPQSGAGVARALAHSELREQADQGRRRVDELVLMEEMRNSTRCATYCLEVSHARPR